MAVGFGGRCGRSEQPEENMGDCWNRSGGFFPSDWNSSHKTLSLVGLDR